MGFNQAIQFIKDCSDVAYCIVYVNFAEGFIPPFILLVSKDKNQGPDRSDLAPGCLVAVGRVRSGFYPRRATALLFAGYVLARAPSAPARRYPQVDAQARGWCDPHPPVWR